MAHNRNSKFVQGPGVTLEVYVDGSGPAVVVLPSFGRDGGNDFDFLAGQLSAAGFQVLRPQPRGIAGSKGSLQGVSLHDLANDIALVIRELAGGKAIALGHAFGHGVARMLATDHPELVLGVILASSQASQVEPDIAKTPHQACDLNAPKEERLAALKKGFFAPGHDPSVWLDGWYPETMAMEVASSHSVPRLAYWNAGSAPILEIIPDSDPFKPRAYWEELRQQLGARVSTEIVPDASHALFPEQPEKVSEIILAWCRKLVGRTSNLHTASA